MTDLNKEREAFEASEYVKTIIHKFEWSEEFKNYQIKDCVINGNIFDLLEAKNDEQLLNGAWFGWQEKAKAQTVPEGYVVVPKEPTREMLKAGVHSYLHQDSIKEKDGSSSVSFKHIYQAMLEASESGAEQ